MLNHSLDINSLALSGSSLNPAEPDCPAVADILFIMDSTGSIGEGNYKTMLTFVANFTRSFALGPNWVQFSVITFGDNAHNEFSFSKYTTHSALEKVGLQVSLLITDTGNCVCNFFFFKTLCCVDKQLKTMV